MIEYLTLLKYESQRAEIRLQKEFKIEDKVERNKMVLEQEKFVLEQEKMKVM